MLCLRGSTPSNDGYRESIGCAWCGAWWGAWCAWCGISCWLGDRTRVPLEVWGFPIVLELEPIAELRTSSSSKKWRKDGFTSWSSSLFKLPVEYKVKQQVKFGNNLFNRNSIRTFKSKFYRAPILFMRRFVFVGNFDILILQNYPDDTK